MFLLWNLLLIRTQHVSDDKIGSETEEVREDNTTGRSNAGESILDGSADRNISEEKLFEKDNEEERDKIHENSEVGFHWNFVC